MTSLFNYSTSCWFLEAVNDVKIIEMVRIASIPLLTRTESSRHMNYLRTQYNALQDGFNLVQRGNWTHFIQRPGSNKTQTEMGMWSVTRSAIPIVQTLTGNHTDQIWMLYSNENQTKTGAFNCKGANWIPSPYVSGTTIKNLFYPYETYQPADSLSSFNNDGKAPFFGCLQSVSMAPYSFMVLVPETEWLPALPAITKFTPGHDA